MDKFNGPAGKKDEVRQNMTDMCCPKGGKYHEFHVEVIQPGYSSLVFPKSNKK